MAKDNGEALTLILPMVGVALGLGTAIAATAMGTTKDLKKEETKQLEMELTALREERESQIDLLFERYGIVVPED